ncbi:unnamed protein product [Bursaphelenchus xylophilus]|uniref:(pine wood nematode) hypothetical protein n=1 Tax=Bursaphelenchus xylophilus TaxID=6326 RepID=A0A1I7RV00_BURXY|nr:unnamed protein product [Bursaphelenchus xylophilus]CAG9105254.1 unnamed protein product [Bursaphelenchus xylophilus]
MPQAFLSLYKNCQLAAFLPEGTNEAALYTYEKIDGALYAITYTISLTSSLIQEKSRELIPGSPQHVVWNARLQRIGVIYQNGNGSKIALDDMSLGVEDNIRPDNIVITPDFTDFILQTSVLRQFPGENKTQFVGNFDSNGVRFSYQRHLDVLYVFTAEKCNQIFDYSTLKEVKDSDLIPCTPNEGIFQPGPSDAVYDFDCAQQEWTNLQNYSAAYFRFKQENTGDSDPYIPAGLERPSELRIITSLAVANGILVISITALLGLFLYYQFKKTQKEKTYMMTVTERTELDGNTVESRLTVVKTAFSPMNMTKDTTTVVSRAIPVDTVVELLNSDELNKIFEKNEVEGLEAERPNKPLDGLAKPDEGFFTTFKKVGVTLPARIFTTTFGEFDLNLNEEPCTVQYEDMGCKLNRIDAIAAVMRQAQKYQKNGTIQEFISTAHLDQFNIRLMVVKKLGPSIEKQVLSGTLSSGEKLKLVAETFKCMEDLQVSNIVHRDIKPSSFRYEFDGAKIFVTNLGLARIPLPTPRKNVPFFGSLIFASPASHLKLERSHFDDMISWFFVILWIFNQNALIWKDETDKTKIYRLKRDLLNKTNVEKHLKKHVENKKARELLRQVHELIVELPDMKKISYRKIKQLFLQNSKEKSNPS